MLAGPYAAQADQILTAKACRAIGGIPDSAITSQQDPDPPRPCRLKSGAIPSKPAAPSYVPSAPVARPPPVVTAPSAADQILQAAPSILGVLEGLQQFAPQDQLSEPPAPRAPPPGPRRPIPPAFPAGGTFDQGREASRSGDYCGAARLFAQAARHYKAQGDEARLNYTLLQVNMNRQQCSERQGATAVAARTPVPLADADFKVPPDIRKVNAGLCYQEIKPKLDALRKEYDQHLSNVPSVEFGPLVEVGPCAERVKKLTGSLLAFKVQRLTARAWEAASCVELQMIFLKLTCECAASGHSFSTDLNKQDRAFDMISRVRRLRDDAREHGILNPEIRNYVGKMQRLADCINDNSIALLERRFKDLEAVLDGK